VLRDLDFLAWSGARGDGNVSVFMNMVASSVVVFTSGSCSASRNVEQKSCLKWRRISVILASELHSSCVFIQLF